MNSAEHKTEYHDIILTDIKLHTVLSRKPRSWYRAIYRSIRNLQPGRFFSQKISMKEDGHFELQFPIVPDELKNEQIKAERLGKKLRIFMPRAGIPVFLGEDAVERLRAVDKKLALRTRSEYY